jgi:hypothetical protein
MGVSNLWSVLAYCTIAGAYLFLWLICGSCYRIPGGIDPVTYVPVGVALVSGALAIVRIHRSSLPELAARALCIVASAYILATFADFHHDFTIAQYHAYHG